MSAKNKPELTNPPELFYDRKESGKYHRSSRIQKIQREIAERCVELLEVEEKSHGLMVLDIGCGTGISTECVTGAFDDAVVAGMDISSEMLNCVEDENVELFLGDIGEKWPFSDGVFDYAISCSVIQWLFQSYKKQDIPARRIRGFFSELHRTVKTKAVLQFYASRKETEILTKAAKRAGFVGGLQVDGEGTRNEKKFLVLWK
ncbi:WBS22 [Enterospora canceri]|uniref:WBS22 n=1 Tax=Enterospora canceri TaxID=1081671 RepID=A0A1Y1S7T9_9MICR|nr:WBS22 [Enterospora canceri]